MPCHRIARVSRLIDVDFYAMRDITLLTDLYEYVKRPTRRVEVSEMLDSQCADLPCIVRTPRPGKKEARLYRALARQFDPMRGTCIAYLIDYDQSVECDIHPKYAICQWHHFSSRWSEVRLESGLHQDDQYSVCILSKQQNGSFSGTVWTSTSLHSSNPSTNMISSSRKQIEADEQRMGMQKRLKIEGDQATLRRMEAELKERAELLRKEREQFEISKRNRSQELSLVTMQLQVANISKKVDTIATSGLPVGALGGLNGCGMLGIAAANAIMQQQWQQTTSHTVNAITAASTTTNQATVNMQQMLRLTGQFGMFGNNAIPQQAQTQPQQDQLQNNINSEPFMNSSSYPMVQMPESTCPSSTASTAAAYCQSSIASDLLNGNATKTDMSYGPLSVWSNVKNAQRRGLSGSGGGGSNIRPPTEFVNTSLRNDRSEARSPFSSNQPGGRYQQQRQAITNTTGLSSYNNRTECSHNGFGEYANCKSDSPNNNQSDRKARWTKKERDGRAGVNRFAAKGTPTKEYYSRRYEGNRYQRRGSASVFCESCHHEGHFTKNCPLNVERSRRRRDAGDFIHSSSPLVDDRIIEKQTFYVTRPRDKDGNLLYTSDESSEDETTELDEQHSSDSDEHSEHSRAHSAEKDDQRSEEVTSKTQLSSPGMIDDEEVSPAIIFSAGHIIQILNYQPYFDYVQVKKNEVHVVKRSDEDHSNLNWPLFFVQLQQESLLDFLEQHLDSLQPNVELPQQQTVVGALCVSYCKAFDANFRAVIMNVDGDNVTVLYVDYGNYETVKRDQLKSIDDQPEQTRNHPGMAIPCILSSLDDGYSNAGGDLEQEDVESMQNDVSCDRDHFCLKFLSQRPDGVQVVEVVHQVPPAYH
ncbi:unnamed protein product [Anisakis simplex]|uniref:Tudor domain-containing protein n=1 Tax=Anisakis simplex TaxID=6269 RepID=A0A0M3K586_ANISI|nr:unnamed protein product [Anisakis simplex]